MKNNGMMTWDEAKALTKNDIAAAIIILASEIKFSRECLDECLRKGLFGESAGPNTSLHDIAEILGE